MARAGTLLLLALAACGRHEADDTQTAAAADVHAQTARAVAAAFTEEISSIGTVSPRPGRYAELAAPAPTRVARILVTAGQRVRAGDTLIVFERASFDAAARSAEAGLATAQHAAERADRLVKAGILPRKEADQAAQALADAQTAAVTARRNQELASLLAPLDGVVTRMTAVMGAAVDPTQTLVAVADPSAFDIVFALTPDDAARVHPGDAVRLRAGEAAGGDSLGAARIADVGAAVDSASRNVPARARLTASTRPLRLGETVLGRIVVATHPNAVVVPLAALVPTGEGFQVFVVDSGGIAHAREVTVGGRGETLAEIVQGLAAGEVVVTTGAYGVTDSAKIERPKT